MRLLLLLVLATACAESRATPPAPAPDPQYDAARKPDELLAALRIAPDARVADVGAGTGYLTTRIARLARHVVATDIDPRALARIPRAANVETRVVAPDEPGLEAGAYDLILLSRVDQYLPDRKAYFARLRPALAPGGRIAIANAMTFRDETTAAAEAAGLTLVEDIAGFPGQYLLVYR